MPHTFKSKATGITYTVEDFTGKHQRLLSENKGGASSIKAINTVLADCIQNIGSLNLAAQTENEKLRIVKSMPSEDRVLCLYEIRQYTFDFDKKFKFIYEYESVMPETAGQLLSAEIETEMELSIRPYGFQVSDLSEIVFEHSLELPRSCQTCYFHLNNGELEEYALRFSDNLSSHTPLLTRRPRILKTTDKKGNKLSDPQFVDMNLDNAKGGDIEALRGAIEAIEGRVVIRAVFKHPEAAYMPPNQRLVTINPLAQTAFFYPSMGV